MDSEFRMPVEHSGRDVEKVVGCTGPELMKEISICVVDSTSAQPQPDVLSFCLRASLVAG